MPKLNNQEMTEIIRAGAVTEHFNAFAYEYWEAREASERSGQEHRDPVSHEIPVADDQTIAFDFSGIQLSPALQGIMAIWGNTLFISWRGTVNEAHIRADLQNAPADASFAENRGLFLSTLDDKIGSLNHQDKLNIVFFGHSLGGAIAQLSIDAVTTAILNDSNYPNISFDKIETLTLSTANSPGVSQEVRGRYTENSSKCKGHGLTLNALLLRTQGDIIQHHCPQLASVGTWDKRGFIIRPGVFKSTGKTFAGTVFSCSRKGFARGLFEPSNDVDTVVNNGANLANKIAVHKEQYLIDQLIHTPNTIIYTPHDDELAALQIADYYNTEKLCGLILVTDSDHFNRHVAHDENVSPKTRALIRLLNNMIPATPEPVVELTPPASDANQAEPTDQGRTWTQFFSDAGKSVVQGLKWSADTAKEYIDDGLREKNIRKRRKHFEKKIDRRCQEREEICNTFHQSCEKLYVSTAFRICKENAKKLTEKKRITDTIKDYRAITKHLTTLINNPPSFLRYLGFSQASISWDGLSASNSKLSEFKDTISDNSLLSSTLPVVTTQTLVTTRQKIRAILRQERDELNLIRPTGWNEDEVIRKERCCILSSSCRIQSKPLYATWESVSSPPQARQSLS